MQSQLLPPPLKVVGYISGKHGFQGKIQIHYLPGFSKTQIKKGNYLFVVINGKGVPFLIQDISKLGDILSLQFIESEHSAKSIIGCEIAISAQKLKSKTSKKAIPDDNSLLGLMDWKVCDKSAGDIGTITEIQELPQGFILTVQNKNESFLIPLVEEWITSIDESQQIISMELPEGLLGINQ